MAGISSKAVNFGKDNKYEYNGIEQNTDFDLNMYDAFYRNLDPQIGRFWQIDPITNHSESPFVSMGNNPVKNMDWLGNYFTWGNKTVEETYKKLQEENCNRLDGYMKELAGLDLNSTDKKVQNQVKQLTNLINSHAELNGQWDEMEKSDVEFHVTNEMPTPGAAGETNYSIDDKRVNIRLGKSEKNISTMAHEFRHGYGYLIGEMMGAKGVDPLYDMMDEVVASNTGFLFTDRNSANLVADGYYNLDWFKNTQMSGEHQLYKNLSGREEQLTTNTAAATYKKYNPNDRISFVLGFKNNANMTVMGAINVLNAQSQKIYNKPEYYTGPLLNNR